MIGWKEYVTQLILLLNVKERLSLLYQEILLRLRFAICLSSLCRSSSATFVHSTLSKSL